MQFKNVFTTIKLHFWINHYTLFLLENSELYAIASGSSLKMILTLQFLNAIIMSF